MVPTPSEGHAWATTGPLVTIDRNIIGATPDDRRPSAEDPTTCASTSGSMSSPTPHRGDGRLDPPAWPTGQRGTDKQPRNSVPLQRVFPRVGWASGKAVVIVISGPGRRTASAFGKAATSAARAAVEYPS